MHSGTGEWVAYTVGFLNIRNGGILQDVMGR